MTRLALTFFSIYCLLLLGAGGSCRPKKNPMGGGGGGGGPNPSGNPSANQGGPARGKPGRGGAQDDLERDAAQAGDNQLNDDEEATARERERQRDALSQVPPTDNANGTRRVPSDSLPQTTPGVDPKLGQLPRTQPNPSTSNPNPSSTTPNPNFGAPGLSALPTVPGLDSSTPGAARGLRRRPKKKTH